MQRLKTRAQFQAVMAPGSTVSRTAHFALHRSELDVPVPLPDPQPKQPASAGRFEISPSGRGPAGPDALFAVRSEPWVGALLPKRWAKRAVTRNTIKRQIYAVSQALEPQLRIAAHVVRLRSGFDKAQFPSATSDALKRAVRAELQELFARSAA